MEGSRVTVIHAHPLGRASWNGVLCPQTHLRGQRLQLVRQRIVVPSVLVVKKTSHFTYEINRVRGLFPLDNLRAANFTGSPGNLTHPSASVKIPQASRRIFYIRLQMKDRVAVLS